MSLGDIGALSVSDDKEDGFNDLDVTILTNAE